MKKGTNGMKRKRGKPVSNNSHTAGSSTVVSVDTPEGDGAGNPNNNKNKHRAVAAA